MALDKNSKTFAVYVVFLNLASEIHQDIAAQIAALSTKEVKILDKYSDFANVFSEEKTLMLPKRTKLNEYTIELENGKQSPYRPIHSLGLVELKTLKTYIKTHLKTGFIRPFKSFADAFILFGKKPDNTLCQCVNY